MGTSTSLPTPTGGDWTKVKKDITALLGGNVNVTPDQIVGGAIVAAGGLGPKSSMPGGNAGAGFGGDAGGGGGGGSGGGGGGGGGRSAVGRAAVGRAASGLGGFAAAVGSRGLDAGLASLGLDQLRGRPASEVVARIAEHLSEGVEGLQGELLRTALQETLFEAAALEGESGYQNLGDALQVFLDREGVEGLVESFLTNFVFDRILAYVQSHIERRSDTASDASALETAIERSCRGHVENLIDDLKSAGRFDQLDWFGRDGQSFGQQIAADLESRLSALAPE